MRGAPIDRRIAAEVEKLVERFRITVINGLHRDSQKVKESFTI